MRCFIWYFSLMTSHKSLHITTTDTWYLNASQTKCLYELRKWVTLLDLFVDTMLHRHTRKLTSRNTCNIISITTLWSKNNLPFIIVIALSTANQLYNNFWKIYNVGTLQLTERGAAQQLVHCTGAQTSLGGLLPKNTNYNVRLNNCCFETHSVRIKNTKINSDRSFAPHPLGEFKTVNKTSA